LASAERSYFRALAELRRARKERLAEETETEKEATPKFPPRPQPAPPSAEIGFVLPNPPQRVQQGGAGASACQRPR
jgi:hypothetical protein